jgi:hypothetical protein
MEIPRFAAGKFNERIAGSDAGRAFQVFAGEVLAKRYPRIHAYGAGGRDGGIDLDTQGHVVVECKHCDDGDALQKAWGDVAERLRRHLADPDHPGQSQYSPWYAAGANAIVGYRLVTDGVFANRSRIQEFQGEIRAFFEDLGKNQHLAHLRALDIEVLDWNDFESELKSHPELLFRWFPSTRPNGLMPLDEVQEGRLFRSFLSGTKLPYYSRSAHVLAVGNLESHMPQEDDLLLLLEGMTGLIITGKGGVGKTRLTIELGHRGKQNGWIVLRASAMFRDEAIDDLLSRFVSPTDVLILIDYVEMIESFADRIEHIEMLNATLPHRIRYVANCRTSYYRNVQTISGHARVDVSPTAGHSSTWLEGYRRAIVEKVLSTSGIDFTPAHLKVCRDVPVFAVFMAFLQNQKRTDDLHELVTDGEFGRWIARRVQQSFGQPIGSTLAMLVAAFPMEERRRSALSGSMRELFERLAADGWIEKLTGGPDAGLWVTAHDAIADRLILNHIENLGAGANLFIEELFDFSEANDGISSVLIALQRLGDSMVLQAFDWVKHFAERMHRRAPRWLAARMLIMQNNLIPVAGRIELLESTADCWDDLVGGIAFQNVLGWICKQVMEAGSPVAGVEALRPWVLKAADQRKTSGYILSRGLVLFPELRAATQHWLETHPIDFRTSYIVVAWLNQGYGTTAVARYVAAWIQRFAVDTQAPFVYRAWLNSGGDRLLVESSVGRWLALHAETEAAQFLYHAWLDAGGDRALVEEPISRWLTLHSEIEAAQFVYKAWLDAGGGGALVEEAIRRWLKVHDEIESAQFVYPAWLSAVGDRALVEEPIRRWLTLHAEIEAAGFVYRAWLDAGGDQALVEEPIKRWIKVHTDIESAQFVYCAWLDAGGDRALVEEPIRRWLTLHSEIGAAQFVYKAWLDAGGGRALVEEAIRRWLKVHDEIEDAQYVYRAWLSAGGDRALVEEPIRRWLTLHAEIEAAGFVYRGWLDAGGDQAIVEEGISRWLKVHDEIEDAQYVYRAWLSAGGDRALVEEPITRWLTLRAEIEVAGFVYRGWLDAGGDRAVVEEPIKRWLALHAEIEAAGFVYRGWLDAGGDQALVEEGISRWLKVHDEIEDAQYVYRAWLSAGGDLALVEEPITRWLTLRAEIEVAGFVYRGWLDAGGDRALAEEAIGRWLKVHDQIEDAQYVYRAWLSAGGHRALIEEPMRRWFTLYAETQVAGFVYRGWLDAGGDRELIEEPIRRWLALHDETEEAGFVYRGWLDAQGAIEVLQSHVIRWFGLHSQSEGADFVVVAYLKRGGSLKEVRGAAFAAMARLRESAGGAFVSKVLAKQHDLPDEAVLNVLWWCRHFAGDDDALWRFSQLGEKIARAQVAAETCSVAERVLAPWLSETSSPTPEVANNITRVIAGMTLITEPSLHERVGVMLARWLRHPRGFSTSNWCPVSCVAPLVSGVRALIEHGVVDMTSDAEAIDRFAEWKRQRD